jgi:hypothetical protein
MTLLPDLNRVECFCVGICLGIQLVFLLQRKIRPAMIVLAGIAMLPATLLAATAFTRFLSWDESYIFYDIVNYHSSDLPQWRMGAFRTSIITLGPLFDLLQKYTPVTKDVVLVLAKAVHWITGVFIIAFIINQLHRLFYKDSVRYLLFYCAMFNAIMLLPVTGLALKTLNYDLLPMLLGVLGCIWCAAGVRDGNRQLLLASVAVLTLAAQEKLIASPLLMIGMAVAAFRLTIPGDSGVRWRTFFGNTAVWAGVVIAVSLAVVGGMFAMLRATHKYIGTIRSTDQFLSAYTSCLWPVRRLIPPADGIGIPVGDSMSLVFGCLLIFCAVFTMVLALHGVKRIGTLAATNSVALPGTIRFCRSAGFIMLTGIGIIAGYTITTTIWPLVPVPPGRYLPGVTFNGIAHYFGCGSFFSHTVSSIAWAYAVFVNALPTALLVMMAAGAVVAVRMRNIAGASHRLPLVILSLFFLTGPLLYGALQIPVYPRYLNVFLLGAVISLVPELLLLRLGHPCVTGAAGAIVVAALYLEVVPFQPLGDDFHPLWSHSSKAYNTTPAFGNVAPWHTGWGEELYGATVRLRTLTHDCSNGIRVYYNFPGALIRKPDRVTTSAMPKGHGQLEYRYGDCDFYILSRNGISSYPYVEFPANVPPLFTIEHRDVIQAWVYRGSDLGAALFHFENDGGG